MYPVDLHTHTIASTHAYSTINEYAQQAAAIGIRLFATTDHGPALADGPHLWHFFNLRVLPRQLHGVTVLRGVEANIVDGELDCPDAMLACLDIVLAGLHTPCQEPLDIAGNTAMLCKVIAGGKVQVITHPGNPLFPVDVWAVAEAATRHHVALEVNNASFLHTRKGSMHSCVELIAAQRDLGGWVAVNSDAHHTHSLGHVEESLKVIRAVNFPEERIINTSPEQTLRFLAECHGKDVRALSALCK